LKRLFCGPDKGDFYGLRVRSRIYIYTLHTAYIYMLQGMIDKLTETGRCYGMEMNVEKTK